MNGFFSIQALYLQALDPIVEPTNRIDNRFGQATEIDAEMDPFATKSYLFHFLVL